MDTNKLSFLQIKFLKYHFLFFTTLYSCSGENFDSISDCSEDYSFKNLTKTTDTRGNFEMKIPKDWKKEFYLDTNETRLYFADTTKQLNETFIIDIGLYMTDKKVNTTFFNELKNKINNDTNTHIINYKKINIKDKSGYVFYTKNNNLNIENNRIEIFISNLNNSYYLIKVDTYGNKNLKSRQCEALQLLNYLEFNP